jgi:hypothetical protein
MAAFLPGYEHDVFVSYAHEEQLGDWTLMLQEDLRKALNFVLLSKLKGKSVEVWIDEILKKNLPLTDQLRTSVDKSALLLIVMSPFYLGSPWCGKEVAWFAAAAGARGKSEGGIFVVHAYPTDRAAWPPVLAELTPFAFFARHPTANEELPLGLIGDEKDKAAYKAALYNLAGQMRQQIDDLLAAAKAPPPPPPQPPLRLLQGGRDAAAAPGRFVCLETAGASPDAAAIQTRLRTLLAARDVEIFSPADLGAAPRDPLLAERFLQKLVKAKAGCDGLLLLRLDDTAAVGDWVLDYLSEVRPMATRLWPDRSAPPPLLIDAAAPGTGAIPKTLSVMRVDEPDFDDRLAAWVDGLPVAQKAAA